MRTFRSHMTPFISGLAGGIIATMMLGGVVYAANGGSLLIGRANTGTRTTILTNSAGTPLSLGAKAGYAPFKVNNGVKVTYLNADKLDSLDSKAFARSSAKTGEVINKTVVPVDVEPDGTVDYYMAKATCPAGTILTGGGGAAFGNDDLFYSGPSGDARTWEVDSVDQPVEAYAICLNLRGAAPASLTPLGVTTQSSPGFATKVQK